MSEYRYVIGIDFGTDSVRAIIINVNNGKEESSHVSYYKRWMKGEYCDSAKNQFRQHPLDYIESLEELVKGILEKTHDSIRDNIIGIGIDTTGSTPAPVDKEGTVLALRDDFSSNPNAMFILWKDHTAVEESERINKVVKTYEGTDYTKYVGGVYSSEWFWAKVLHILRVDKGIRDAAYSWVEHADWIPAILTGNTDPLTLKRSRCAAGHKAMWNKEWGGLPSDEFLSKVDPILKGIRSRLYTETYTSDNSAGGLTKEWAERLGLKKGVVVSVGAFDAHMGAVGAEIGSATFVKILGTSCCDIAVASKDVISNKLVKGICGQVEGSVIPGMIGLEAGQSAYGDIYSWFKDVLSWPIDNILPCTTLIEKDTVDKVKMEIKDNIIDKLSIEASKINPIDSSLIAIDWLNGRRTPYADQKLKGAFLGFTLGTDSPKIFRALVEATAFGAKAIIEHFKKEKIKIAEVVGIGGITHKSPLAMQILADVLDMPVKVVKSTQAVALGAAMFGAVAAGYYKKVEEAQKHMGSGFIKTYYPIKDNTNAYRSLYSRYRNIGKLLENELRK